LEIKPYNLPPFRSLFRAPDGYKLLVDDLSQAHMRIATEASQDENLLEIYQNRQDFHSITASKLASQQGLDWSAEQILEYKEDKSHENHDKAKLLRDISKNANYGGINVQGYKTLQSTCRNAGTFISDEEAQNGIEAFRNLAPRLYNYQRTLHKNACDTNLEFEGQQYAWTRSWSGRLVYLPKKPNDYKGGRLEPKISDVCAVNWTSTEADSLKHSVGIEGFLKDIDEHPEWGCELCIIVHDESVALVKEDYAEEAAAYLKQRMHEGMQLFVKSIPVDEEDAKPEDCICDTWLEK
ncbi:MAG: DNA polymerase, partial [Candidatus Bipolaricaulia bacterium]